MSNSPSRKVAITGGTGFIGRPLVRTLLEWGNEVRVLSRRPVNTTSTFQGVRWFQGDVRHPIDPAFLKGVDTLYHLAAELSHSAQMEAVNVQGTANLLTVAKRAGVRRWIQLSSVGVYGKKRDQITTEETEPAPDNKYKKTKLASDQLVAQVCRQAGINHSILRPSNVVGVEMKNRSVFELIKAIRNQTFFYIGPQGALATYVHVDDVARALAACQSAPDGSIYNLSSDCAWEELVEHIALEIGVPKPRYRIPEFPVRAAIKLLEGRVPFPLTLARLDALTRRCGYSSNRIMKELKFQFSKPMPVGICDLVGRHLLFRHGQKK